MMEITASIVGRVESTSSKRTTTLELVRIHRGGRCADDVGGGDQASLPTYEDRALEFLNKGTSLLQIQWPGGGPEEVYREKIVHHIPNCEFYSLPCSFVLVKDRTECVGHGRLQECFESAAGSAAAATYIVIDSTERRSGLGRHLMSMLENEAKRLGYHYVYLWTKTAVPFYERIGYGKTERVSLYRPCLKQLQAGEVSEIEQMLRKRSSFLNPNSNNQRSHNTRATKETVMLPPDDNESDKNLPDVWLRKRLVECVGSVSIDRSSRIEEMNRLIKEEASTYSNKTHDWKYLLLQLPWQAQVGPSCGLVALRMVRDFFRPSEQMPSLLSEAMDRGYSQDGEMFNINHLKDLAETVCGIKCHIESAADYSPSQAFEALSDGSVIVFPYDTNHRDKLPCSNGGHSAHYGILVGLLASFAADNTGDESETVEPKPFFSPDDARAEVLDHIDSAHQVYMLVQHSLSRKLSIAKWSEFISSNLQLKTMDGVKFSSSTEESSLDLKDRLLVCERE